MNTNDKDGNTPIIKKKWSIVMNKSIVRIFMLILIAFGVIIFSKTTDNYKTSITASELQPEIAEKILRFHVLANSDSQEDQAVKIKVRDAVGKYIEPKL